MTKIKNVKLITLIKVLSLVNEGEECYARKISYTAKTTYCNISLLFSQMEREGLVTKRKEGKITYIKLTTRGESFRKSIMFINNILKVTEVQATFENLLTNGEYSHYKRTEKYKSSPLITRRKKQ